MRERHNRVVLGLLKERRPDFYYYPATHVLQFTVFFFNNNSITSRSRTFGDLTKEQYRSLRCGSRQGSALRSDELRELQNKFAPPLTASSLRLKGQQELLNAALNQRFQFTIYYQVVWPSEFLCRKLKRWSATFITYPRYFLASSCSDRP